MTAVLSGTNGLLQSYDYQVLTTGFSYTFAAGVQVLVIQPAGTLATGTVTMPAAPTDGMTIAVVSTQQVTAVTVSANTGQSIVGTPSQLVPNQPLSWVYRLANTTWYPFFGGAGRASSLVQGTAVASTSGTSIDFTGIPSWVERITVMFSGVSTNGSSLVIVQLGTGGVPTTSGYQGATNQAGSYAQLTTGLGTNNNSGAADTRTGLMTITNISSNTWVSSAVVFLNSSAVGGGGAGVISLAGVLNLVRITTVNGTDTFDAGSVNILYE
jgi:hypothetical protein